MNTTKIERPLSSTASRALSLKWSLLQAYNSLLDSLDDMKAIEKDETYVYAYEDRKEIKNMLAKIQLLFPELKEKI